MELPRIYSALNHLKLYSIHGTNSGCVGMVVDGKRGSSMFHTTFQVNAKGIFCSLYPNELVYGKEASNSEWMS